MSIEQSKYPTLSDVAAAIRSGEIPRGSTVEVADAHPELVDAHAAEPFLQALKTHGVSLIRNAKVLVGPSWIYPPGQSPD